MMVSAVKQRDHQAAVTNYLGTLNDVEARHAPGNSSPFLVRRGRRACGWQRRGNRLTQTGTMVLAYNHAGRMKSGRLASTSTNTTYLYNALGQLVQETLWLGDIPVATLRPKSGGGVDLFYVHSDHLNTPRKVTRPSDNQLRWRWDPDPFGTSAPNQNPQGLGTFVYHLRLPGQYFDTETALHYNYFRDYDPQTGRYLESDPIGLTGGINTYGYVGNDPVNSFDTDGLDRRRINDPDVTQICSYYDNVCRRSGGKCNYPCKTAPFICRHPDTIPSLWVGVSSSQVRCIRTCLISEDKKAQKNNSNSASCTNENCLSNDTIDAYHRKCYTSCGVGAWRYPGVNPAPGLGLSFGN
jgi:RHS repeat-associated protein